MSGARGALSKNMISDFVVDDIDRSIVGQLRLNGRATNQQIADEIGLSVKTVESYRARLMKKLGLKERADLVRLAIEMGII